MMPPVEGARMRLAIRVSFVGFLQLASCSKESAPAQKAEAPAPAPASVDGARLNAAAEETDNWLTHGRTYHEQRFSPLKQITAANVGSLGLAWSLDLDTNRGQEATPLA